jgi:hypothetical protein
MKNMSNQSRNPMLQQCQLWSRGRWNASNTISNDEASREYNQRAYLLDIYEGLKWGIDLAVANGWTNMLGASENVMDENSKYAVLIPDLHPNPSNSRFVY